MRVASEKAQLSDTSRIESVSKNLPANCYKNLDIAMKIKLFVSSNKINQNSQSCHLLFQSLPTFAILAVFPTFRNEFCWQCPVLIFS